MTLPLRNDSALANVQPSQAVKNALRLYVSGACKTKKEASEAAGLHPAYLAMLTAPNGGSEPVKQLHREMDEQMQDMTLDMSSLVTYLGRKALLTVDRLMEHSGNERIILESAKELMDRSSELQKTQKVQVDSFTLDGKDVASIVSALAESARVAQDHAYAAAGVKEIIIDNFDKPQDALPVQQETPKEQS